MPAHFITHARLDRRLGILARRPEHFVQGSLRLCAILDAREIDLEISDPSLWRGVPDTSHVAVDSQFSAEIAVVQTLGREEELRLAVRIEFAKIRLERTLEKSGLDAEDLERGSTLSPIVCRRRLEWHAMRLEMFERNLYLALINVDRYRHTTAERSDMIQAGAATLFRAVDGFDWRRGLLFRTYAVHWLNQGFRDHLYNFNSTVRIPIYQQKPLKHIHAAIQFLGDARASAEDIAGVTGFRPSLISSALTASRRTRSLDAPLDSFDGARSLASELAVEGEEGPYSLAIEDVSIESGVSAELGRLNDRERLVVQMRFGIGYGEAHTYAKIAEVLGVSLERARQILVRAMSKMRTPRLHKVHELLVT